MLGIVVHSLIGVASHVRSVRLRGGCEHAVSVLQCQVMEDCTGSKVYWRCAIEVEQDKRKREWLKKFSKPEILCDDVTNLGSGDCFNLIDNTWTCVPNFLACYTFGYSCKDLSTLNNASSSWKDSCLADGAGSTGRTWSGNLEVVFRAKPWILLMENVPAALKGKNYQQMVSDLASLGYQLVSLELNSADCGLPQDRRRGWFTAVRTDLAGKLHDRNFRDLVDSMKIQRHLPLRRFLLDPLDPYLAEITKEKLSRSQVKALAQAKAKAMAKKTKSAKAKAKAKIIKRSGDKWKADHWRVRRSLNMLPASEASSPIRRMQAENGMCDREMDLYRVITEGPAMVDPEVQPCVELKHSAPRVVGCKNRRRAGSTSCLLPSSKLMLMPPLVPSPRFLTGLEAMQIQGVDGHHLSSDRIMTDGEYMHLAGNAFSGGACALMFLATIASLDLRDLVQRLR